MTRSILQLVHLDETGDSYYRMRWPAEELARRTGWSVVNLDARAPERLQLALEADLLILFQSNDLELLPIIDARRARGRKTLVEYNDNFYAPQPWSPVAHAWCAPPIWHTYEAFMRRADAVLVTGPGLRALFSSTVPGAEILEIPNFLPTSPTALADQMNGKTSHPSIGWGGSFGHLADLLSFMPCIDRVLSNHPQLTLHLMGNALIPHMCGVAPERLKFSDWGGMSDYFAFWKPVRIGFIPLLDTEYNRCRSDIKAVEMAAHGVVPIVPNSLPYRNFIAETGAPSYKSTQELESILDTLISQPDLTLSIVQRCFAYVSDARVEHGSELRHKIYESYLPDGEGARGWPRGPGYHEIRVQGDSPTGLQVMYQTAQQLVREHRHIEAARLLRTQWERNSDLIDAALSELRVLLRIGHPQALLRAEEYATAKPLELRFKLLWASIAPSADRPAIWNEILETLQAQPAAYARFYESEVVDTYIKSAREIPSVLERLLHLYPSSARLRFDYAELLRICGRPEEARIAFAEALEIIDTASRNTEALKDVDRPYVEMWLAALTASTNDRPA